ncbi:MAG: peptidoglycan DD-metalloendopeptidase family protein [Gammaproteobacteria bacterium]
MSCLLQRLCITLTGLLVVACSGAVRWDQAPAEQPRTSVPGSRDADGRARPAEHRVQAGETLYGIAFGYGLDVASLAAWNGLGDGTLIRVGQVLRLTPPTGATATRATDNPAVGVVEAPPRWQWPAAGPVLVRYGESPLTASGVQLGGQPGDLVRAASGGQVVYAGNGLVGYGELLIIKHSANWLSAYGYNRALLVREGEQVDAGQPIARMGEGPSPGLRGRRSLLHFEIRRNGIPVDPLSQLPAR